MNKIKEEKMLEITGGAVSKSVLLAIAAAGVFIVGVFDGFFRPLKCN